jgi:hypothetical protein
VQQRRVRRPLVERQEDDVFDAPEALQRPAHLPARVDSQRALADAVDHDDERRRGGEPTQLGVIAEESADAQRIRRRDRDDQIRLEQGGGGGRMSSRAGEVIRDLVVRVEGSGHIHDRVLDPSAAGRQRRAEPGG